MSKINIVVRLQHWMDSVPGQTFLNYAYSWGASIVILGALFKLTHLPGGNFMLFMGMGTEVVVFFLSAFDRPFDKDEIGKELPHDYETDEEIAARLGLTDDDEEADDTDEDTIEDTTADEAVSQPAAQPVAVDQPAAQPAAAAAQPEWCGVCGWWRCCRTCCHCHGNHWRGWHCCCARNGGCYGCCDTECGRGGTGCHCGCHAGWCPAL